MLFSYFTAQQQTPRDADGWTEIAGHTAYKKTLALELQTELEFSQVVSLRDHPKLIQAGSVIAVLPSDLN